MRFSWGLVAIAVVLAGCGSKQANRMTLHTPDTDTGHPMTSFPVTNPTPTPTPTPEPTPKPQGGPVTRDERRVIQGWADELRHSHVNAASRYFTVPSFVSDSGLSSSTLVTLHDVREFNAGFPCGAKLVKVRRSVKHFVIGTFTLTERPGKSVRRHRAPGRGRVPDPPSSHPDVGTRPRPGARADADAGADRSRLDLIQPTRVRLMRTTWVTLPWATVAEPR